MSWKLSRESQVIPCWCRYLPETKSWRWLASSSQYESPWTKYYYHKYYHHSMCHLQPSIIIKQERILSRHLNCRIKGNCKPLWISCGAFLHKSCFRLKHCARKRACDKLWQVVTDNVSVIQSHYLAWNLHWNVKCRRIYSPYQSVPKKY